MHKAMAIRHTGNDNDFVPSMIPHRDGAVDMAQVQLKRGKDRKICKLAGAVIRGADARSPK